VCDLLRSRHSRLCDLVILFKHMPASVVSVKVPFVKMDDRKRSGEELAPPSKRQAVNGKSASADADMPWSADLEVSSGRHTTLYPSHRIDLLSSIFHFRVSKAYKYAVEIALGSVGVLCPPIHTRTFLDAILFYTSRSSKTCVLFLCWWETIC
jgi:hypothetical protein